jgi:hypothetical protein
MLWSYIFKDLVGSSKNLLWSVKKIERFWFANLKTVKEKLAKLKK